MLFHTEGYWKFENTTSYGYGVIDEKVCVCGGGGGGGGAIRVH